MNIVEPILFQSKLNPFTAAICVPGSKFDSVRYGMLGEFIHNVARTALKSGIGPGNIVATFINDTILHTAVVLGLMHAGATTLSLRGPRPVPGITPDVILTDVPDKIPSSGTVLAVD
jgi:acyl-CoA synthetase (AMP-forming)/AMP-acid ligase II